MDQRRSRRASSAVALTLFSLVIDCSGGGSVGSATSSSGGGSQGSCQTVCDRLLAANCPADTPTSCMNDCEQAFAKYETQCQSEATNWLGCLQNNATFTCGADGKARANTQQAMTVCSAEEGALVACSACISDGSSSCDTCVKTKCCSELKAYASDPNLVEFENCLASCTSSTDVQACSTACENRFPALKTKIDAYTSCQIQQCAGC
jgi:hypothetical protein